MGRSSNPRKPLPAERGAKRTGAIGSIVPGDDVEVAREIARIWDALSHLKVGSIKELTSEDSSVTIVNPKGPVVDLAAAVAAGGSPAAQTLSYNWSWASGAPTITYVSATTGWLVCDLTQAAANKIEPLDPGDYSIVFGWSYNNWSSVADKALTLRIDPWVAIGSAGGVRSTLRALSTGFPQHSASCSVVAHLGDTFFPTYYSIDIVHGGAGSYPTTADGTLYVTVNKLS
jgi:hypothetical protein